MAIEKIELGNVWPWLAGIGLLLLGYWLVKAGYVVIQVKVGGGLA